MYLVRVWLFSGYRAGGVTGNPGILGVDLFATGVPSQFEYLGNWKFQGMPDVPCCFVAVAGAVVLCYRRSSQYFPRHC